MIKKNFTKVLLFILVTVFALPLFGCSNKSNTASAGSEVDKIKKAGKIVVGTSADYPPYEFHAQINGKDEIIGFDIAIAKEIAKDLGVQLEIKDMKFDGLLAALDSGNIDFVIAGMTPDAERAKQVDFSKVYYTAVQSIVVRAEDKDKIKSVEDLKGKTVGVQKGSIQEKLADQKLQGSTKKGLGKVSDLMLELKNKKVDAIIVEYPVAVAYSAKNTDLAVSDIKLTTDEGGSAVAIKKGNQNLVGEVNKTLDRLIGEKAIEKFFAEASEYMEK